MRAYVYLVLISQVQARSSIVGNSALTVDAQQVFKSTFKTLINEDYSIAIDIEREGSILGSILLTIFINNLFLWLSTADLHNFADDNTISAFSKDLQELIKKFEDTSECEINWFRNNCMIVIQVNFNLL